MINILVADDHPIVREGLKQILSRQSDIMISGEASNCAEVMSLLNKTEYDLLLLDIKMPDKMGLDILEEIKNSHPKMPVLILSTYPEKQYAISALKLGARGYLVKEAAPHELIVAIERVIKGGVFVSASLAARMAEYLNEEETISPHEKLSRREYQVMLLLAAGKTVSDISKQLLLSVNTVSTYRTRILKKMDIDNNIEIAHYAIKQGLVV